MRGWHSSLGRFQRRVASRRDATHRKNSRRNGRKSIMRENRKGETRPKHACRQNKKDIVLNGRMYRKMVPQLGCRASPLCYLKMSIVLVVWHSAFSFPLTVPPPLLSFCPSFFFIYLLSAGNLSSIRCLDIYSLSRAIFIEPFRYLMKFAKYYTSTWFRARLRERWSRKLYWHWIFCKLYVPVVQN